MRTGLVQDHYSCSSSSEPTESPAAAGSDPKACRGSINIKDDSSSSEYFFRDDYNHVGLKIGGGSRFFNSDRRPDVDRHSILNRNPDHYMISTNLSEHNDDNKDKNTRSGSMFNPEFLPNFNDMIKSINDPANFIDVDDRTGQPYDVDSVNRYFSNDFQNPDVHLVSNYPQLRICLEEFGPKMNDDDLINVDVADGRVENNENKVESEEEEEEDGSH